MGGPTEVSNQQILEALSKAMQQIGSKLDTMNKKLDAIQDSLGRIEHTADQILNIAEKTYTAMKLENINNVRGSFKEALGRLADAASADPSLRDYQMRWFRTYLAEKQDKFASFVYSDFKV